MATPSSAQNNAPPDGLLLIALSDLAVRVQRARTVQAVFATASEGLQELGYRLVVTRLEGEETVIEHFGMLDQVKAMLEATLGRPLAGLRGRRDPRVEMMVADGKAVFLPDLMPQAMEFFRQFGVNPSATTGIATPMPGILAPISVRGQMRGYLSVTSERLRPEDAPAWVLFAAHLGSAVEVAEVIERLERRQRELSAIHELSMATPGPEPGPHCHSLAAIAERATSSDRSVLYRLDAQSQELVLCGAGPSTSASYLEKYRRLPAPDVRELSSARMLRLADWPEDLRPERVEAGFVETALVPMTVEGRLAGQMVLGRSSGYPFTEDEVRSAVIIGRQIVIQFEKARMDVEARQRLQQLSLLASLARIGTEAHEVVPMVERMLPEVAEALGAQMAMLHLVDGRELRLVGHFFSPPVRGCPSPELQPPTTLPMNEASVAGQSAMSRRTVEVGLEQMPQLARSLAGRYELARLVSTPLLASGRLMGTFAIGRRREAPLTEAEIRLLESCASHVARAIEHATLFEEERRRVHDLSALNELGTQLAQNLDLDALLAAAVAHLSRICDTPNVFLMLLDPSGTRLRMAATNVSECTGEGLEVPLDQQSAAAEAVRTLAPVIISSASSDPRAAKELAVRFGHRSLLALPLIFDGRPMGVAVLGETRFDRRFDEREVELAVAVSNQLAAAVSNAQLYADLKKSYAQLERTQAELVRHERLAALGELGAVMAHEVRNPLGVIFNSLTSLKRLLRPGPEAQLILDIVQEEAERLNRIVGDLLDFARPYEASVQPADLESVIVSAVEIARTSGQAGSPIKVEIQPSSALAPFPVDAHLLRQALVNLLINAGQAMPKGGEVKVRVALEKEGLERVAHIEVVDQGLGISPQHVERIFQPFFTTKATGTGLGLAVVKRIVDAHQGEVVVRSRPGEGTTFVIRLPERRAPPAHPN